MMKVAYWRQPPEPQRGHATGMQPPRRRSCIALLRAEANHWSQRELRKQIGAAKRRETLSQAGSGNEDSGNVTDEQAVPACSVSAKWHSGEGR